MVASLSHKQKVVVFESHLSQQKIMRMNDGLGRVCSKYGATTSLVNVTLDGEEYISSLIKKPEIFSGFIFIQKTLCLERSHLRLKTKTWYHSIWKNSLCRLKKNRRNIFDLYKFCGSLACFWVRNPFCEKVFVVFQSAI